MNVAYVEAIGGASGNMLLGGLIDAGADPAGIVAALRTIPVGGWDLELTRVTKRGIAASYADFRIAGEDHEPHSTPTGQLPEGRHLAEILAIVEGSALSSLQKARARAIYTRLAEAEARAHGSTVEGIHFHEVGATDAVLDVAGACVALDLLGVERVYCSPFPLGRGTISMHHGTYPNPPPATAELLRGSPTYDAGFEGETVTTTGAAILATLVERPGERPMMAAARIGYGAGRSDFPIPNVLRVSVGELLGAEASDAPRDEVVVLEATIDDMSPQYFELAFERVQAAGAFDVWLAPVTMKKSRPAILLGAVAPAACEAACAHAILAQTTTLGVRVRRERRYVLERTVAEITTEFGPVRVKSARLDGGLRRTLEYDDVVRIARERGRPIAEIAQRLKESLGTE